MLFLRVARYFLFFFLHAHREQPLIISTRIFLDAPFVSVWLSLVRLSFWSPTPTALLIVIKAKERSGFGSSEDNAKFENPWRRDGPLPDLPHSRDPSRRRFDGPSNNDRQTPSASDTLDQWRSNKPLKASEPDAPPFRRKGSGFVTPESQAGAADKEDVWTIGSRFKPFANGAAEETSGRSVTHRAKSDMGPPKESPSDEGDWRSSARIQKSNTRGSVSRKINRISSMGVLS